MIADLNRGLLAVGTPGVTAPALAQLILHIVSGRSVIDNASRAAGVDPHLDDMLALQETFSTMGAALDGWVKQEPQP